MKTALRIAALLAFSLPALAQAQPGAVHKTTLGTSEFPPPNLHTVTVSTRIDPGGEVAPHSHPGQEMAYIVSGRARVRIKDQAERTLGPGDFFAPPPGVVHAVANIGPEELVIVSTYVVEKDQPILTPGAF